MNGKGNTGVKVFGSAVLRVEPNMASLQFAVSRQAKLPKDAFEETHKAVKVVRAYLTQTGLGGSVASSRVTLTRAFEFVNGRNQPCGYLARVAFNVQVTNLDNIEDLLVGVVQAGAFEIEAVEFRTTQLKEYRAEARRRAVAAAREKAEIYCQAAGAEVGAVLGIEDMSPDILRGSGEGHTSCETSSDEGGAERPFAPGSIVVGAAVSMVFAIHSE